MPITCQYAGGHGSQDDHPLTLSQRAASLARGGAKADFKVSTEGRSGTERPNAGTSGGSR